MEQRDNFSGVTETPTTVENLWASILKYDKLLKEDEPALIELVEEKILYLNKNFVADEKIERCIETWRQSSGAKKAVLKDTILFWFLQNRDDNLDMEQFTQFYQKFIKTVESVYRIIYDPRNDASNDSYVIIEENPTSEYPFVVKAYNVNTELAKNNITFVKAVISEREDFSFSAKFENGGFELYLPATIPDEYLKPFGKGSEKVFISDAQAKFIPVSYIEAYSAEGQIGRFRFFVGKWDVVFIYVDRNLSTNSNTEVASNIDGSLVQFSSDYSLKKGWNIKYSRKLGKTPYPNINTSKKPLDEPLKCYFTL